MSNKHETRKPETKLPTKDKDAELEVQELEERIAPSKFIPGRER